MISIQEHNIWRFQSFAGRNNMAKTVLSILIILVLSSLSSVTFAAESRNASIRDAPIKVASDGDNIRSEKTADRKEAKTLGKKNVKWEYPGLRKGPPPDPQAQQSKQNNWTTWNTINVVVAAVLVVCIVIIIKGLSDPNF
jgi:hypothetical protein